MVANPVVRRVDFGYFVRPAEETGTGKARVEPCLGYLVEHPDGLLLMDTGMGAHPEVDAHYRPARRALPVALADAGVRLEGRAAAHQLPSALRPQRRQSPAARTADLHSVR